MIYYPLCVCLGLTALDPSSRALFITRCQTLPYSFLGVGLDFLASVLAACQTILLWTLTPLVSGNFCIWATNHKSVYLHFKFDGVSTDFHCFLAHWEENPWSLAVTMHIDGISSIIAEVKLWPNCDITRTKICMREPKTLDLLVNEQVGVCFYCPLGG